MIEQAHEAVLSSTASGKVEGRLLRAGEKVALSYFLFTAASAMYLGAPANRVTLALFVPLFVFTVCTLESRWSTRWSTILRDWLPLALIVAAYWQVDWFPAPANEALQQRFLVLDRFLLDTLHLRALIELTGPVVPSVLEGFYLMLYAMPPACMAAIYFSRRSRRADRFLLTLFLGTFTAYALLPYFPSLQPRVAFPGVDLPTSAALFRPWNLWVLDHLDISTSVFPSGHVAVAFSCAFGMLRAVPEKRWLWLSVFVIASAVFIATIYARYHYAMDGIASITIATAAWYASNLIENAS